MMCKLGLHHANSLELGTQMQAMNRKRPEPKNDESRTLQWFTVHPTPYHEYFFRALVQVDAPLKVHYQAVVLASHPWQADIDSAYVYRVYKRFLGLDWYSLFLPFTRSGGDKAVYVVASWNDPTNVLLISLLRLLNRRFVLWTDTPNIGKKRRRVFAYLRIRWLKWAFSGAYRLLTTGTTGTEALKKMGAPSKKLVNFPFWCDLQALNPALKPLKSDDLLVFISSGRLLNSLKGHDIAIKALAVAMEGYKGNWEYRIAGTGPDRQALEELAKQLSVSSHVVFMGWAEATELARMYLASDFLLHPSPIHDPFPNAILEGMAAGLVVMGSDVCGSAIDRIEDGVNGFIHEAGDWRQLSTQIREVVLDKKRIESIQCKARATAELWPVERGVAIIKQLLLDARKK